MKIENSALFDQAVQNEKPFAKAKATVSFAHTAAAKADALGKSARVGQTGYDREEVSGRSALEEFEEKVGSQMDVRDKRNQMAVLSNTMTPEDYRRAQEEGFSVHDSDVDTLVTAIDKIKVQLAKAGVDVSAMGSAPTKEQLEAIGGSVTAVNELVRCFEAADLPETEENLSEGLKAYRQAEEIAPLSKDAIKYLLSNCLQPTIANLYLAQSAVNAAAPGKEESPVDADALRGQIERVIAAAGSEVNERTVSDGVWMIQNGISFTVEQFTYVQKLSGMQPFADGKEIASAIATAIAEGGRPTDAMLLPEYSATAQAEHAVWVVTEATDEDLAYLVANNQELTVENLERAAQLRKEGKMDLAAAQAVIKSGEALAAQSAAFGVPGVGGAGTAGRGLSGVNVPTAAGVPGMSGAQGIGAGVPGMSGAQEAGVSGLSGTQQAGSSGASGEQQAGVSGMSGAHEAGTDGSGIPGVQGADAGGSGVAAGAGEAHGISGVQGTAASGISGVQDAGTGTAASGISGAQAQNGTAISFLTAKRVLEETRLAMTTEANRALLKQGISIDTKPLEALVERLKQQEQDYYAALLKEKGAAADASMTKLFQETAQKVSDLKQMPAYVLGMQKVNLDTVNALHEAGTAMQKDFERAGERYEPLMTAPRRDLGDSIQKAFSNVGDILNDLGMEATEANQRAVRILGYNSLEITKESVLAMKAADERVQRTFANLTPATVREFIRQGENPLDLNLDELNRKAEAIRAEHQGQDTERFSEYLWKLEHSQGISKEERESFIGVYRLMNQIEKSDGAVIGALVSQGAEFTMRNLLTAVRSAKKSGMDYTVDDEFAGVDRADSETKSITDQIETAYQAGCMKDAMETLTPVTMQKLLDNPDWEQYTPEQLKQALEEYARETAGQSEPLDNAYAKEQLEELKQAASADEEVYRFLSRFEIPDTVSNILAANRFMGRKSQIFSRMFNSDEVFSGEKVDFAAIREEILGRFAEALKTPKEMAAAQESLAETAENVMKTMISEDEHISSMDIRELKLMNAQLSIAGRLAREEQYTIPVLVGDEVTNLSLKIVRGTKKKGMVEIMFETAKAGKIAACIEAKERGVSGLVAVEHKGTQQLFEEYAKELAKGFGEGEADLQVTQVDSLNFSRFSNNLNKPQQQEDTESETYQVQTARLYKIARSFIENVKELEF